MATYYDVTFNSDTRDKCYFDEVTSEQIYWYHNLTTPPKEDWFRIVFRTASGIYMYVQERDCEVQAIHCNKICNLKIQQHKFYKYNYISSYFDISDAYNLDNWSIVNIEKIELYTEL